MAPPSSRGASTDDLSACTLLIFSRQGRSSDFVPIPLIETTLVENFDSHDNRMFPDPHHELDRKHTSPIENDHLGDWSPEKDCC